MQCRECKSKKVIKAGTSWSGRNKVQRYQCRDCGRISTKPIEQVSK